MCLRSTYFSDRGNIYKQKEDATMNSPLSAVVANLFEKLSLETTLTMQNQVVKEVCWWHILYRSFAITKGSGWENGALPYIDTLLRRREGDSLDISVYREVHAHRLTSPLWVQSSNSCADRCGEMSLQQSQRDYQHAGKHLEGYRPPC